MALRVAIVGAIPTLAERYHSRVRDMPDGAEPVTVNLLGAIDEVSAEAWDACAQPHPRCRHRVG